MIQKTEKKKNSTNIAVLLLEHLLVCLLFLHVVHLLRVHHRHRRHRRHRHGPHRLLLSAVARHRRGHYGIRRRRRITSSLAGATVQHHTRSPRRFAACASSARRASKGGLRPGSDLALAVRERTSQMFQGQALHAQAAGRAHESRPGGCSERDLGEG